MVVDPLFFSCQSLWILLTSRLEAMQLPCQAFAYSGPAPSSNDPFRQCDQFHATWHLETKRQGWLRKPLVDGSERTEYMPTLGIDHETGRHCAYGKHEHSYGYTGRKPKTTSPRSKMVETPLQYQPEVDAWSRSIPNRVGS